MATLARIGYSQLLLTQINYSPIIFINGQNYKGNYLNEQHLMETLCLSFQNYPAYCSNLPVFTSKENVSNQRIKAFFYKAVGFSALISGATILLFYFIYKQRQQRSLKKDLQKQIDQALTDYYNSANQTFYRR